MNMTLRQFQAFLAVAEHGSFSRAAERLHMAQPTLSVLVRDLEAGLGVRLFDRTTRRTELTEAGREFRAALGKIMDDLDHAVRIANDFGESRRGRIAVAAPPLLAASLLPPAIAAFRRGHGAIRMMVMDVRTDVIVDKVRSGEADCGVGTFPPGEDGIAVTRLARDELMLFCASGHPLAARPALQWSEAAAYPIVALTRDSGIRLLVEMAFERCGRTLRPAFEVDHVTTALALAEADLGVAVLPSYAWTFARHRNLAATPLEPATARELSLIRPAGRAMSPALEAFARILHREVQLSLPRATAAAG